MRTSSLRFAISALFAAVLAGCASLEPPFEWDPSYSTPGTSLKLHEVERLSPSGGSMVSYELRSTGFTPGEPVTLWQKNYFNYRVFSMVVKRNGIVQFRGLDGNSIGFFDYAKGQAIDFAVVSQDGTKRAHAKVIPFPIEARGTGRTRASGELIAAGGRMFLFTFAGFNPDEEVQVTSRYQGESHDEITQASAQGGFEYPVYIGGRPRGQATLTAKGRSGTVTIRYNVGRDAMIIQ